MAEQPRAGGRRVSSPVRQILDIPSRAASVGGLPRIRYIVALVFAAFWLPATQHCGLEAAGLFPKSCSYNCASDQNCARDGCGTLEDGACKPASDALKVPLPDLFACVCHLCSHLVHLESAGARAILPGESFDRPRDWASTWHFVRRAAPAPRAPSLFFA